MKAAIIGVIAGILIMIGATGGYFYGRGQGYSNGYNQGHDAGYESGKGAAPSNQPLIESLSAENGQLRDKYNSLIDDYNRLANYANAARRQPIDCTSTTYGINDQFTSTSCY